MKDTSITPSELDELFHKYHDAPESYVFVPLADACRKIGRVSEALEICDAGIKQHPSYASGYVVRGKCLYDMKLTSGAKSAFQTVLDLDADNLVALKYLGRIEADDDNFDGARDYFKHILALDPDNKEISDVLFAVEERERSEIPGAVPANDGRDGAHDHDLDGNAALAGSADEIEPQALGPEVQDPEAQNETDDDADDPAIAPRSTAADEGEDETPDASAAIALADIFASQGYGDRARKIYQKVLSEQPDNRQVRQKLDELDGGAPDATAGAHDDEPHQAAADYSDVALEDATQAEATDTASYDDVEYDRAEATDVIAEDQDLEQDDAHDEPAAVLQDENVVVLGTEAAADTQEIDELPHTIQLGPVEDVAEETDELDHAPDPEPEAVLAADLDTSVEQTVIITPPPPAFEEADPMEEVDDLDLDVADPDVIHLSDDPGDAEVADGEQDTAAAVLEAEEADEDVEVTVSEILEKEEAAEGFQEIGDTPEDAIDATPSRTVTTRRKRRKSKAPTASDDGRQINEKDGVHHFRRWINHIAD